MRYRLYFHRCWLTPAMQEKVRKERTSSTGDTPEIRYKRKKVCEDHEFADEVFLHEWVANQRKPLDGLEDVLESYVDLWGFLENPSEHEAKAQMECFFAEPQELPLE